jgi:hypothetical protein
VMTLNCFSHDGEIVSSAKVKSHNDLRPGLGDGRLMFQLPNFEEHDCTAEGHAK